MCVQAGENAKSPFHDDLPKEIWLYKPLLWLFVVWEHGERLQMDFLPYVDESKYSFSYAIWFCLKFYCMLILNSVVALVRVM